MRPALSILAVVTTLAVAAAVAAGLWLRDSVPVFTESEVRDALLTTIERESPEAFLVTGRLDLTATTRVENSKIFLPGLLGISLGTARASVRVPGSVSYGFEVDSLQPEMVRLTEEGIVEVEIPGLAVYQVSPDLSGLEVETERGWARPGSLEEEVERRALTIVEGAMRRQALAHLRTSYQPRINAARALEILLRPALQGLGMEDPVFRFRVSEDLVIMPSG